MRERIEPLYPNSNRHERIASPQQWLPYLALQRAQFLRLIWFGFVICVLRDAAQNARLLRMRSEFRYKPSCGALIRLDHPHQFAGMGIVELIAHPLIEQVGIDLVGTKLR